MKKVTGIILAVIMLGSVLGGCYSKTCEQPCNYKDQPPCNTCK